MGRKHYWYHANAPSTQAGNMICTVCYKQITSGDFRYRETEDAYLTQHRGCCQNDTYWKKKDRDSTKEKERFEKLLVAATGFKEKWQIDDLDDLIAELQDTS